MISVVLRSGSNPFRGGLYEYRQNAHLNGNNWFNNFNGVTTAAGGDNLLGGTAGAPIRRAGAAGRFRRSVYDSTKWGLGAAYGADGPEATLPGNSSTAERGAKQFRGGMEVRVPVRVARERNRH